MPTWYPDRLSWCLRWLVPSWNLFLWSWCLVFPDNRFPLPWYLQKLGWLVYIPAYSISFDRDYFSTLMEHSLGLTCWHETKSWDTPEACRIFDFFSQEGCDLYFNEVILVRCFPFSSADPREVGKRTLFFKIPAEFRPGHVNGSHADPVFFLFPRKWQWS